MLLALSIVSEQGGALGAAAYKVFDKRGGSIGRITGNDWVLPDSQNFVSSRHARVSAAGGIFYLEDTSSNGTFINAPDQATSRAHPQPLNDGDRLYIGDYEIVVQIIDDAPALDPLLALADTASVPRPKSATPGPVTEVLRIDPSQQQMYQAAVQAAIRAAFNSMLAKLHPQSLEEVYERKLKRTAMLGIGNKAKYWDLLRAQFEEIDRDREAHFQLLFGEEFAQAYNEHLQKLVADARLRGSR